MIYFTYNLMVKFFLILPDIHMYMVDIMNQVVVHNRDPTKNCENTLIERTPKTIFKAF